MGDIWSRPYSRQGLENHDKTFGPKKPCEKPCEKPRETTRTIKFDGLFVKNDDGVVATPYDPYVSFDACKALQQLLAGKVRAPEGKFSVVVEITEPETSSETPEETR